MENELKTLRILLASQWVIIGFIMFFLVRNITKTETLTIYLNQTIMKAEETEIDLRKNILDLQKQNADAFRMINDDVNQELFLGEKVTHIYQYILKH